MFRRLLRSVWGCRTHSYPDSGLRTPPSFDSRPMSAIDFDTPGRRQACWVLNGDLPRIWSNSTNSGLKTITGDLPTAGSAQTHRCHPVFHPHEWRPAGAG